MSTSSASPTEDAAPDRIKGGRWWFGLLLGGLLLALMPVIATPEQYHGDERFYTDATLTMVRTGDYWTPRYADGSLRLQKPILAYWAIAASFHVFGTNLFAARLPFLLAGVLLVVLTAQLAQVIWRDRRLSWLAALIIASNIEMLTLSTRATPDILVCLFVAMSMWGFARMWFQGDASALAPLLAYGGMGLAIQSKGLMGVLPLGANLLFLLMTRPERTQWRRLWSGPALLLGLVLGGFWYVVMLQRHGLGAMQAQVADQVSTRLDGDVGFMIGNFVNYLMAFVRHALPWTLVLLAGVVWQRRALSTFWRTHRRECLFLISLAAILVVVFTFGNIRRTRYLAASYPMVAVLLAGMLAPLLAEARVQEWLHRLQRVAAGLVMGAGVLLLAAGLALGGDLRPVAGALVLFALGGVGLAIRRHAPAGPATWTWIAATVVVVFALSSAVVSPVFSPTPLRGVAVALGEVGAGAEPIATLGVSRAAAAELRLLTGGRVALTEASTNVLGRSELTGTHVLTTSAYQGALAREGYTVQSLLSTHAPMTTSRTRAWIDHHAARAHGKPVPVYWLTTKPATPAAP
jgi:4-amino-4-deoxy-L-arabinose transferase-like glycosyltransferase